MKKEFHQLADGRTIDDFITALSHGRQLFALEAGDAGQYHLVRAENWDADRHTLGSFRPIEPLKSTLSQPREFLGSTIKSIDNEGIPLEKRIVIGVKNCDLAGLKIQDYVFGGLSPGDPQYLAARENTILVTCDCSDCLDVCFCPIVGEQPYAKQGYDINISPVSNQFVIDAGSDRGQKLLENLFDFLAPVDEDLLEKRTECRADMFQRVVDQAAEHGLQPGMDLTGAIRATADSSLWGDFAVDCVECGACNFVCCTCHCFLLADGFGTNDNEPVRGKQWDSCLLMNFARVAGGLNPRAGRAARLRNRFQKKFTYFPEVLGQYACDGCGRCTEVCTGNIDIRAVLKRATDETKSLLADTGNN